VGVEEGVCLSFPNSYPDVHLFCLMLTTSVCKHPVSTRGLTLSETVMIDRVRVMFPDLS